MSPSDGLVTQSTAPISSARVVISPPRVGEARHHDDGSRPEPHQPLQELDAAHVGHLDIEGQDIGAEILDGLAGFERIRGMAHHFEIRVRLLRTAEISWRMLAESSTTRTRLFLMPAFPDGVPVDGDPDIGEAVQLPRCPTGAPNVRCRACRPVTSFSRKALPDLGLRGLVEIDHDVAAEDDVELVPPSAIVAMRFSSRKETSRRKSSLTPRPRGVPPPFFVRTERSV